MLAEMTAGPNMRAAGEGIPTSSGTQISWYLVVRWAAMLGGLQEKEKEVSDNTSPSNLSTG